MIQILLVQIVNFALALVWLYMDLKNYLKLAKHLKYNIKSLFSKLRVLRIS